MSGWELIALILLGIVAYQWVTKQRIGRLARNTSRNESKLWELLRRWI